MATIKAMTTKHTDEKKPARSGLVHNADMDVLDYAEARSAKTVEVARKSYDDLHERAYKLATVLVGGGGAVGAYTLGKLAPGADPVAWAPLAALALSWLGTAAHLIWVAATSRAVSPGNGPENLLSYHKARLADGWSVEEAIRITREAELALEQARLRTYLQGCNERAEAIDRAYKAVAIASPAAPLVTALLIKWLAP